MTQSTMYWPTGWTAAYILFFLLLASYVLWVSWRGTRLLLEEGE